MLLQYSTYIPCRVLLHTSHAECYYCTVHTSHAECYYIHPMQSATTCIPCRVLLHASHAEYYYMHPMQSTTTCIPCRVLLHASHAECYYMHPMQSATTVQYIHPMQSATPCTVLYNDHTSSKVPACHHNALSQQLHQYKNIELTFQSSEGSLTKTSMVFSKTRGDCLRALIVWIMQLLS